MKKLIAVLMTLTILLALAACGSKAPATTPTNAPEASKTDDTQVWLECRGHRVGQGHFCL